MPVPDRIDRPRNRSHPSLIAYLLAFKRRKRPDKRNPEDGGVPVEPNRPSTLSGGAAAALEFDE